MLLHGFPPIAPAGTASHRCSTTRSRTLAPPRTARATARRARAPTRPAAYRLEELLADVLALLDAAGVSRAHVVGHDWRRRRWLLAANHPDRVATVTALSTPHPAALSRALRSDRGQQLKSWYMAAFQVPWVPERVVAALFHSIVVRTGMPLEDAERYAAHLAHADALAGPIGWYRATASSHVPAHRCRCRPPSSGAPRTPPSAGLRPS
ncbi:alpha/beta fold hydrolase [Humibacillus xanthopallidus]|uniref:alpha/beta fold hydrolase n=1 Tax=Humibacillus xanthopallidus TaxID=412689 RepID=UPI001151BB49|nr:alpha/beta fold hydrolase [Humibacillus xanthopallidus]